ncbi:uncharacterized protein LOC105231141 [Bactrocera dorsalis]|uniref:Uncharacterized protein LOC105231141 n=1 Tax=Bactrocera dorsalis TaxID=27457 RepID=A0ABM3K2F3_BACDO|nr:uncharacterized protein LOC105231141 [Bactrocera dorsalis]XP_049315646.1 uncharacterized protein LOC105231141 [Bactrocera dorsalis]
MFTKMQKFYILAFSIATVLVFADAYGYAESGLRPATTTAEAPIVGATVTVGEQALEGVQLDVNAKAMSQQKLATTHTPTLTTTATATTGAAAATTTKTVTLGSSNAPATLTSANDADEQVLNTATTTTKAAQPAEWVRDEQAKPTQLQQQQHAVEEAAAAVVSEAGGKQQMHDFVTNDVRKRPQTATTNKINAAAHENGVATPAMPTSSGSATAGGTTSIFGEAPAVNVESKSRADTLPPGNRAASNGGRGAAKPEEHGNVANTQIIKNVEELRTARPNDERADVYADELDGERTESTVGEIETAEGVASAERGVRKVTKQWEANGKREATSDMQPIVKENSGTAEVKKPQEDATAMWLKEAVTTSKQMTGVDDTKTLSAKYTVSEKVERKPEAVTKERSTKPTTTNEETTMESVLDDTATTQTAKDGINIELRLTDGLYRIKLAEIVTDEYNGSGADEQQQVQQATAGAQTTDDAAAASASKPSKLPEIQVSAEAGYSKARAAGAVTTIHALDKPQKQQAVTEQVGQHAQQTALTKPVKQKAQHGAGEQELVQQQPQQLEQPNQLRRKQPANKDIENRQVQQHKADTASELDNMNSQHMNNNNKHESNNSEEQNDHVENTKRTSAVIGSRTTPPALNIVDLYPMKMEDFNPIIRDSNAKLLKARTIYKPVDSDDADQQPQPAEGLYAQADDIEEIAHQQNLLPNEVNAADNIVQRYDNINNLAAARHSVNRRPSATTTATTTTTVTAQSNGNGVVAAAISSAPERRQQQADSISDFTGKLLAEQDGVITEIEQKFRLNEFAATPTGLPTAPPTTKATTASKERQLAGGKATSYSVNHKVQPTKGAGNKYTKYKSAGTQRTAPQQHDFIERRVKKSFDFPMHRAASVSDALGMPHVDFANTKFNTDAGATQSHSDMPVGGAEGGNGALRTALGTHPEFSTTKFYNSKELYNEMMLHNRQRLKAKAKVEQAAAAAATTAKNTVESAASRFALRQSAKLATAKYTPNADTSKAIAGEVHVNSQQRVNSDSDAKNVTELRADNKVAAYVGSRDAENAVKAKSAAAHAESKVVELEGSQLVTPESAQNAKKSAQMLSAATTVSAVATQPAIGDKSTKKYQKELQRAKLLLKTLLLPPTSVNATSAHKFKPTVATARVTTTRVIAAANGQNYSSQVNLHTPHTADDTPDTVTVTASHFDALATAKTFDIKSLPHKSQAVTPPIATDAAVGNIDSATHSAVTNQPLQRVNFDGVNIVHVKRAQPAHIATTAATTTTKNGMTTASLISTKQPFSATTAAADPTTPTSLIYPYLQLQRDAKTTHISQPHDTTATVRSTSSTMVSATRTSAAASTTTITTTANLSKSSSKPIVRPRILSRLQEKINSLECEIQNVPSDAHLWRGNETHELLLPIMTSENCPYGGTDCSPLLVSWEGEAEIQSGDILIVEINDTLLHFNQHHITHTSLAHNTQVYQVTRSGHEHCDVTEGILLDITPLVVDGRKLVTLYDKDLTEGVNLLIVVSELWGAQCVRLKVTAKTDNCGESAECSGKGVCYSNSAMEEYECQCCSGFAGPHCEEIDACTPSPCTNNGICVDLSQGHEGNSYQCLCPYGYTGKNCQYESDPCNSAECMNGGSCVGNSTHFRCDCTPGYTGPLCQHSLNECESSPCVHGICVDQEDGFRCFCQPGFAGELCNFEYNECESNPCQNDGECIDHIGNFECRCTKGYSGTRCQNKVDFCAKKPCPDGHHCIDHGNDFSCECPGGRNGLDCNQMPRKQCTENLCKHGGTCWTSGASFYCACRPGYTGNMCEDEFVVETVVSSSEFMVDDTSARNFNDKTFGSSVVLKSPIELHNAYFGAGVLAAAVFIVAVVVAICHCKVNQTYRKFSTRSSTFFPILGFGRRSKSQSKLNKHWLSGKGLGGGGGAGTSASGSLRSSGSTTSLTRGHLPSAQHGAAAHHSQQRQQQQQLGGQMHERPFQRHLAMNLENDMYYTVDFSENSQHSPLIQ